MTPGDGGAGEKPELDRYGDVISRLRAGVGELTTDELVRIRALLEAGLEAEDQDGAGLAAILRALADEA